MNDDFHAAVPTVRSYDPVAKRNPLATDGISYGGMIRRRKYLVLATTALCLAASLAVTVLQVPMYRSQIVLEVQGLNESFLNIRDVDPNGTALYAADTYLETQTKLLESESLIGRVVDRLRLTEYPELAGRAGSRGPLGPESDSEARRATREGVIQKIHNALRVSIIGQSRLVKVSVEASNPQMSADVANSLASEYIAQNRENRWDSAIETSKWLKDQLARSHDSLRNAENELQAYARDANLIYANDEESVNSAKLRELEQELSRAQSDRVEKQAQMELAKSSPADSVPRVSDDGGMRQYKAKLLDLQSQLAELSTSYTPEHFKVKRVQGEIAEVQATLARERGILLERIRNDYLAAKRREDMLSSAYSAQAHVVSAEAVRAVRYNILKRQVDADRELYQGMLQKVQGASIASALRASNIRVVDPARPPAAAFRPVRTLNAAMGLTTGLLLSFVFAMMRERNDRLVRGPGDMTPSLNLPELGFIPSARFDRQSGNHASTGAKRPRAGGLILNASVDARGDGSPGECSRLELITWHRKTSLIAESFRAVATSLLSIEEQNSRPRVVLVTSPNAQDGKTVTTTNLAISLARSNRRVLVIDCDLRRPRIHDCFGVTTEIALTSILAQSRSVDEYPVDELCVETFVPDLFVLPAGRRDQDTFRLLTSSRLADLVRRFRREFDCVLLDSPPMRLIADARLVARVADGVIIVCRAGQTTLDVVRATCARFTEDGNPILGTILNDFKPDASERRFYRHYATTTD